MWQGPRRVVRLGRTVITYRGCFRWSLLVSAAVAGLSAGGGAAGVLLLTWPVATVTALGWLALTLRLVRLGPSRAGPALGPGGAGVREPRRPKPRPPSGGIALPLPEDPPGGTAAHA